MEALGNLGINLSYLVVQILNFFIVMLIMSFWAYKPILKVLDERSNKIAKSLEDARKSEESLAAAQSEADKIISEAQAERARIVADSTQRAEKTAAEEAAVVAREGNVDALARDEAAPPGEVGAYSQAVWTDRARATALTQPSLLVDPPDGRLPALTPEAQQQVVYVKQKRK